MRHALDLPMQLLVAKCSEQIQLKIVYYMNYRAIWQEGDKADNLVDELLTLLLLV